MMDRKKYLSFSKRKTKNHIRRIQANYRNSVFGSDGTITGKWRKLCCIISLCVQCPATVMANDSFLDTNSICGKSVSLTGRLITLKKGIYPSHSAAAAVVYKCYTSLFTYARFELFRSWKKSDVSEKTEFNVVEAICSWRMFCLHFLFYFLVFTIYSKETECWT